MWNYVMYDKYIMIVYAIMFDCLCIHCMSLWLPTLRTGQPRPVAQRFCTNLTIVACKLAICWSPNSSREEVMVQLVPSTIDSFQFQNQTIAMRWVAHGSPKILQDWQWLNLNCANAKGSSQWISSLRLVRMLVSTRGQDGALVHSDTSVVGLSWIQVHLFSFSSWSDEL